MAISLPTILRWFTKDYTNKIPAIVYTDPNSVIAVPTTELVMDSQGNLAPKPVAADGVTPLMALSGNPTIQTGQKTVASPGTRQQLIATSTPCHRVYVATLLTNSGNIFLGGSAVSSANGLIMPPGLSEWFNIADVSVLYIDAAVANDGVSWEAE